METTKTVNIRPGVSVLSVLRHLNYKPWFAMAEFVDNSIQSYLTHRDDLVALHGANFRLRVSIELRDAPRPCITIRDNAAGIAWSDYARAFRAAEAPNDRSGLSEFGMGMKSAACWFAPRWRVRTKALGETIERTIEFDIDKIIHDKIDELAITERPAEANEHYTEITLLDLHHRPAGRTLGKIKDHLADIYRVFIRENRLRLEFDGRPLVPESPEVLLAAFFKNPEDESRVWRKDVDFDFGDGLRVHGFAGIRAVGSTQRAGFALMRRNRLIQGSADEGYRPEQIFGNTNSYRFQRLFGELHLEGFSVSHTKDGFQWDENEEPFLSLLREHLDSDELPLLKQAEGFRSRQPKINLMATANAAVMGATEALQANIQDTLDAKTGVEPGPVDPPEGLPVPSEALAQRDVQCRFQGDDWLIRLQLTNDVTDVWLEVSDRPAVTAGSSPRLLTLRLSMAHPFMLRFAGNDAQDTEALVRVACALGIADVLTRETGYTGASIFMKNINDIISEALSRP